MSLSEPHPVFLVSGAGSGIGLTVLARVLNDTNAKAGVLTLCPTPELTALVSRYGASRLVAVYGDACQDEVVAKAINETVDAFGYLTHLISCVGTMLPVETIRNVALDSFRRAFDVNLFSTLSLVQGCLPHLSRAPFKPTIIIVSSGVDLDVYYRGWGSYCSSKAALTRLTQILAHEEQDMNVFGVLPLVTQSPMVDMIFSGTYDHVMLPEERERFNLWRKEGKVEPPEYIADAMFKAAMGQITKDSPEVERDVCGALFIGSMLQK